MFVCTNIWVIKASFSSRKCFLLHTIWDIWRVMFFFIAWQCKTLHCGHSWHCYCSMAGWSEERTWSRQLGRRGYGKPETNERRPTGSDAEQYGLPNHQCAGRRRIRWTRREWRECCRMPSELRVKLSCCTVETFTLTVMLCFSIITLVSSTLSVQLLRFQNCTFWTISNLLELVILTAAHTFSWPFSI